MTRFKELKGYALERKTILCNAFNEGATGNTTHADDGSADVAASQTATTAVFPINGLHVGDIINAFRIVGGLTSAGNALTVDADLRKVTKKSAGVTDASVGAITQVSVSASALMDSEKSGLSETVATDFQYYVLVTTTTAASTAVSIVGIEVDVNQGRP